MTSSYHLTIKVGPTVGREFLLDKREMFIGRDSTTEIPVSDPEVSRRHSRLYFDGVAYILEDLGSTNGTFVNGQRLNTPVSLRSGDTVTLGDRITLAFEIRSSDPDATVLSASARPKPSQPPLAPLRPPAPQPYVPVSQPVPMTSYAPVQPDPYGQSPLLAEYAPAPKKKLPTWVVVGLILIAILVVFCLIPAILIDVTNSWCSLFGGVFNFMQPGMCP